MTTASEVWMRRLLRLTTALAALLTIGCSDDTFTTSTARLDMLAYTPGQGYGWVDDDQRTIDLGDVPVHATKWAIWKLENPSPIPLLVREVTFKNGVGRRWGPARAVVLEQAPDPSRPLNDNARADGKGGAEPPFAVPAYAGVAQGQPTYLLGVEYSPIELGAHSVTAVIHTDAENAGLDGTIDALIRANAVYTGEPDIEVEYAGFRGPNPSTDCTTDGICTIPANQGVDFGNIGLGGSSSIRLLLRNQSECTPYEGTDPCSLCKLTVAADPTRQNIGFGFKPGTNDAEVFKFAGSTAVPFEIRQRNVACGESGEQRIALEFNAPTHEEEYSAIVVLESTDPNEPLIEIPIRGAARNAPVAIAKFRERDPTNPSAPFTDPSGIEPLEWVYFDGRDSWDPVNPNDPGRIAGYQWEILEYPPGANPDDFDLQGIYSSVFAFWLPLAGHYEARLRVWNVDGIESGDTPAARKEFDVIPGDAIHVQLVWDNPTNDQDLHLTYLTQDDRVCNKPWDCYYGNRKPLWFSSPAGEGPNPSLDIDDTQGLGPENINIDDPETGVYRVYVHYFGDFSGGADTPTRNTVRIYLNGRQEAEYRRTLDNEKDIWAVADITWLPNGTGYATPYPPDAQGQIGATDVMTSCTSPGYTFP
ncbi:MAG: hypothetical protein A2341_12745 [Deltaproteobacteria bacterium RIFOXYB12_FULL_58_9]|nr:MAG: hypothetical protein A2341_12745 [Deltaproteobacteria bacterium RIFOXYB12_FULL_58_9]